MLTRSGYSVFVAQGPDEARQIAERHGLAIDLLLSDVVLSAADGPSLAAELRRNCPRASILFISGYPDSVLGRQKPPVSSGEAEELRLLRKPFSRQELDLAIREVLGAGRSPREMETPSSCARPAAGEAVGGCAWNSFCGEAGLRCETCQHFTPTF
ncbi:MAG: hypothetical protein Kow001_08370 [Acidobacteriota bacterium]